MSKKELEDISMEMAMEAVTFEKKHGKIALIKAVTSVLCRTLVEKEVCTAIELQDSMRATMTAVDNQLTKIKKIKEEPPKPRKKRIPVDNDKDYPY
jgi:hypothetical protein|tara:strand:- start:258 stop:545 length:288 start_codon:yes stop_codon:yes gene_type:complete